MTLPTALSPAAHDLLITQEAGSQDEYNPHPAWDGGGSGVTIGIGYDLGQCGPVQVSTDWGDQLDAATVSRLRQVAGVQGSAAQARANALRDVSVPWDAALAVFDGVDVPRTIQQTAMAFPGSADLPADCFGALVSLVYNRGALVSDDPRRIEMLEIRTAIEAGNPANVPGYIRAMKRLWPAGSDLCRRRDAEADLFQAGLDASA